MIWRTTLIGVLALLVAAHGNAQRVSASGIRTDDGFSWPYGTGPVQWLRLRADTSVRPRTALYAWASQIQITEGGDPFGRVALLWSGWENNAGDRTEYWLKCAYKAQPIYEAAHLYDVFNCGDGTFKGRLWNEQYFSWQPRSIEVSLFAANAPLPFLADFQQPQWTVGGTDLMPNRPGIQVDPLLTPRLEIYYFSGRATARRPLIEGFRRAIGKDLYATESRPSPFRDRVSLHAFATLRVNNDAPQTLWNYPVYVEWTPYDGTVDRLLGFTHRSNSIPLTNFPLGTKLTLAYQVNIDRLPYNKFDQPLNAPTREPIDDLRDGENLHFDLKRLNYSYSGAISGGGSVSDGEAPPICVPKPQGTLNITINLRDFIRDLPFDLNVTLSGVRVAPDIVRWSFDVSPNRCVNIDGVNVLVKRLWGQLTARLQVIPASADTVCERYYNLRLVPEGGDSGNWMNGELYALCFENAAARVNVAVRNVDYVGFAGGVFQQNDPRVLYRGVFSEVVEIIRHGDVNGDGCVNDADLLTVLFNFGAEGNHPADINGDGRIDDADLLIVLLRYGNGC